MAGFQVIGKSFSRTDGPAKVSGEAKYLADVDIPGCWVGGIIRSKFPRGRLRGINKDKAADLAAVVIVTAKDIPGENYVAMVRNDYPALALEEVNYYSQAVALVAAPDEKTLKAAMAAIEPDIEPQTPVFTVEDAIAGKEIIWGSDNIIDEYLTERGDVENGFAKADAVIEGNWSTGLHEHLYLETQGMAAVMAGNGAVEVIGSLQCPFYVHNAVQKVTGLPPEKVIVKQCATGGGFGGKEDYPSVLGSYAALLAMKSNHPVKIIFDRSEDLLVSTKRHPSKSLYRMGLDREGKITALDADIILDGGAYTTLSRVVLQRAHLHAAGAYYVPNVRIHSRVVATNTPPNGAFRGFGAPQTIFAMERQMDLAAAKLGMDPLDIRLKNTLKNGDVFPYGQKFTENNNASAVLEKAAEMSDYRRKRELYEKQQGRVRKGIGVAIALHGGGFTGAGEDNMGTTAKVSFDGEKFRIYTSSTEIGQGSSTVLPMIAAESLGVSPEDVIYTVPDTSKVPNTGPTVASRTTMYAGKAVRDACENIKKELFSWCSNMKLPENVKTAEIAKLYLRDHKSLDAFGVNNFTDNSIWDEEKFEGNAYRGYAWIASVVEAKVDLDTYEASARNVYAAAEVGRIINPVQARGQITGGLLQSIGWTHTEDIRIDESGRYTSSHMNSYLVPTSMDAPEWNIELLEDPCPEGCFGSKGMGELPMDVGAPAFTAAIENAAHVPCSSIPVTGEKLFDLLEKNKKEMTGGAK